MIANRNAYRLSLHSFAKHMKIAFRLCFDKSAQTAGMVKRYHASFPSLNYGFDSRYPLQIFK